MEEADFCVLQQGKEGEDPKRRRGGKKDGALFGDYI